jgi:hypothetical protein
VEPIVRTLADLKYIRIWCYPTSLLSVSPCPLPPAPCSLFSGLQTAFAFYMLMRMNSTHISKLAQIEKQRGIGAPHDATPSTHPTRPCSPERAFLYMLTRKTQQPAPHQNVHISVYA